MQKIGEKEKAEMVKKKLLKDSKRLLKKTRNPSLFDQVQIAEFESDECVNEYLGGYEE